MKIDIFLLDERTIKHFDDVKERTEKRIYDKIKKYQEKLDIMSDYQKKKAEEKIQNIVSKYFKTQEALVINFLHII